MTTQCKKCGKEYRLYLDAIECDCDYKKERENITPEKDRYNHSNLSK